VGVPNAAFTPGPWRVVEQEKWPFDIGVVSDDGALFTVPRHAYSTAQNTLEDVMAGVGFRPDERQDVIEENARQIANARLIAAAPSLYADAEFLCARIRELEGEMRDDDELSRQYFGHVLPALARMESALAEARGETL
jgi:hypothetical protein